MIQNERNGRHEHVLHVARHMMTAARTAPKAKGIDIIEVALVTGEDLKRLSARMVDMAEELGMKFFLRDAENILQAECIVIIGTREQAQGLNCGHCGFPTCSERMPEVPCALDDPTGRTAIWGPGSSSSAKDATMTRVPGAACS